MGLPEISWMMTVHCAVTWMLVGLIWTIQAVHYPLFENVGEPDFRAYHRRHTGRITWIVGPLMLAELGTAVALLLRGERQNGWQASLLLLGFNWISTWRVQVPLHEALSAGFDAGLHRRLVATNWWRTAAWTIRGILLLLLAR
jgi:hypothetical protein